MITVRDLRQIGKRLVPIRIVRHKRLPFLTIILGELLALLEIQFVLLEIRFAFLEIRYALLPFHFTPYHLITWQLTVLRPVA